MRLHYVFLAITATLVAVTDATFTSSALEQASEAKLVLPDTAQTMSTRSLKIRETKQESKHEERSGNLNLLTFLPQFLKEMEGKTNADILHRLNFYIKPTDKQRDAILQLLHAHLEKVAKAATYN
ncbi:hypothetical protein PF005_g12445 [Phytophthora fragariae]|uniref:RxLR effector protein n=2 Tax=Phytophthora TaxID=4783 RepID=A0A6A3Z5D9_9STRA|nr:hypothetical protein PF003_g13631 [Phytophthora fragariae]KAE8969580.1 hypothetical protein PR002_g27388 [Phytophthora rubi]KAE8936457.1 hypothetical protein PF009_g13621 [Phytophthora fragariae]KAE8970065.1 hypothetical protein PR001_g27316 [Phytophthora rubi]KAE9006979.1 hypothetical protein PF011_g11328 [Phytophthora fragariae]